MKINKEFILKNLITICCVASILLLFLPFGKVTAEIDSSFINASSATSFNGFDTIFGETSVVIAWLMLICPIILIAMNYIKQIEKYKSILAIVLPILSVIASIITTFTVGVSSNASSMGASMEMKTSPQIGFFLLLITYIATLISGATIFYDLKFSKEGLTEFGKKLKEESFSGIESIKELGQMAGEGVANASQKIKNSIENNQNQGTTFNGAEHKVIKKTNINQTNDLLTVIAQLSEMKDKGILTEEEFVEKKKELLFQI